MKFGDMITRDEFKTRLRQYRLERGLTQQELCDIVGISPVAISSYEKGERFPKLETLIKIADALEVKVKDLLGKDLEDFRSVGYLSGGYERLVDDVPDSSPRMTSQKTIAKRAVRNIILKDYAQEFVKNLNDFLEFDKKEGMTPNIITLENRIEPMSREDYFDFLFLKLQKSLLELKTNYDKNKTIQKEE